MKYLFLFAIIAISGCFHQEENKKDRWVITVRKSVIQDFSEDPVRGVVKKGFSVKLMRDESGNLMYGGFFTEIDTDSAGLKNAIESLKKHYYDYIQPKDSVYHVFE